MQSLWQIVAMAMILSINVRTLRTTLNELNKINKCVMIEFKKVDIKILIKTL
jgi:hypothetical protein